MSQKPELDYIKFGWNKMTAAEFEEHWKEQKMNKKADFIHLIQVGVLSFPTFCVFVTHHMYFNVIVSGEINRCCTM